MVTLLGESSSAVAGSGRWTAQFTPQQLSRIRTAVAPTGGSATLNVQAFDALGNGSALLSQTIQIDALAPTTPTFQRAAGSAITAADRLNGVTINGMAEAGSSVEINWEALQRTVMTDQNGNWSVRFSGSEIPGDSANSQITAVSLDAVGNRSTSASLSLVIDTVAPLLQITDIGGGDGTLSLASGDQQIRGSGEPLRPLQLWVKGGGRSQPQLLAQTTTDARGLFSINLTTADLASIGNGANHQLVLRQSDAAGNSAESAAVEFAVDTIAPTITVSDLGDWTTSSPARVAMPASEAGPKRDNR